MTQVKEVESKLEGAADDEPIAAVLVALLRQARSHLFFSCSFFFFSVTQ